MKEEETKPKIKIEENPKHRCRRDKNIVSKVTCRGQKLATKAVNSDICSSNIIGDQNCAHNTQPTNNQTTRSSSKPLHDSQRTINYAMPNDRLEQERSRSPKRKRLDKI